MNANKQEGQCCYICTSSSQRGPEVIFKTHCDEPGVFVRLSSILNCDPETELQLFKFLYNVMRVGMEPLTYITKGCLLLQFLS